MKRIILSVILSFFGMTIFSQDMSYYTNEFKRLDGSFSDRLTLLETIRDLGGTGIGEFYHEALKYLLVKMPDVKTIDERSASERSARIICQGLGAEKYTIAAPDLWQTVLVFDVVRNENDGLAMQEALIALGKVDGRTFIPQIIQRLDSFNAQTFTSAEARRLSQRGVVGCVNALEAFRDPAGFRPVFFVSVGGYDPAVKQIASNALPNVVDDPADIISGIIQDPSNNPSIKLEAWKELLKTRAPNSSKAKTAAVALVTSHTYNTSNRAWLTNLKDMRKSAIDAIGQYGVADNSVYAYLERTYNTNFINNSPDYDEIAKTLNALAAIGNDEAVEVLFKFLQELHGRRRSGPWRNKERQIFEWVVSSIGATKTQSADVRFLLTTIQRNDDYTSQERNMAANALKALGN